MSWNEATPGLYQRPLSTSEKSLVAAALPERTVCREPIKIHAIADFTACNPLEEVSRAFKDAWKALRLLKSPDIATVYWDGYNHYKVPSPQELEVWVNQTLTVAQVGASVDTTIREMQLRKEPLPICHILPQSTQDGTFKGSIILFISHWRTDAGGSFKIVNQIFDYASELLNGTSTRDALSKHVLGSETRLLCPAMEDILMPGQQSTPESKTRVEKQFSDYSSKLPCVDFAFHGSPSADPSFLKANQRIYTPTSTSSLASACRATAITVTAAVQAAYLGALWDVSEPGKRNCSYTNLMPAQVRKRLPISSPFREQGCWSAAQMLMLTVPPGQDFLARAQSLRQQYGLADKETWLHEDMRETSEQLVHHWMSLVVVTEPTALASFTSVGVLDGDILMPEHGGMKIERVRFWVDQTGPGIVLTLWTFRGRLNIEIWWNAAFHGDTQVQAVMDIIDKTLATELGAQMGIEEFIVAEC